MAAKDAVEFLLRLAELAIMSGNFETLKIMKLNKEQARELDQLLADCRKRLAVVARTVDELQAVVDQPHDALCGRERRSADC